MGEKGFEKSQPLAFRRGRGRNRGGSEFGVGAPPILAYVVDPILVGLGEFTTQFGASYFGGWMQ